MIQMCDKLTAVAVAKEKYYHLEYNILARVELF